jgi:hypothetical protein
MVSNAHNRLRPLTDQKKRLKAKFNPLKLQPGYIIVANIPCLMEI